MEELTDSNSEDDFLEVLEGVVSSTREAITLIQQPSVGGSIDGGSTHPSTSTDLVMESGITSEKVARISTLSEDRQYLKSKPPDTENTKFKEKAIVDNKSLSKSALKRMRKQLKEQPHCSLTSGQQ